MKRIRPPELLVALLGVALLVGAAVSLTRSREEVSAPAGPSAVAIANFSFEPEEITVSVGDTVTWTNADDATHTVTSVEGDTLASEDLGKGDPYEKTFDEPGTFEYDCKFHANMQGTVVVEG